MLSLRHSWLGVAAFSVACSSDPGGAPPSGVEPAAGDTDNNAPVTKDPIGPAPDPSPGTQAQPDAAAPDAAPVGESSCYGPLASALFCSGFESTDMKPWLPGGTGGTATRVTTPAFLGMGALHGASTVKGGAGQLYANVLGGKTSGALYMRGHVYVPSNPAISGTTILAYGESTPPYGGVSLVLLPNQGVQVTVNPGSLAVKSPSVKLPYDKWVCVQIATTISETAGSVTFSIDGATAGHATGINTLPGRGFEIVSAGVVYTPPTQAPVETFVDELAVDTSPIACP
jgi:hypothetical protein